MFMKKSAEIQNASGKRFADLLAGLKWGPTEFARQVAAITGEKELKAQHVNNWRRRGVPSTHANVVAALIGCRPEMISQTALPAPANEQRAEKPEQPKNYPVGWELVMEICKAFGPTEMSRLSEAATWIKQGKAFDLLDEPATGINGKAKDGR